MIRRRGIWCLLLLWLLPSAFPGVVAAPVAKEWRSARWNSYCRNRDDMQQLSARKKRDAAGKTVWELVTDPECVRRSGPAFAAGAVNGIAGVLNRGPETASGDVLVAFRTRRIGKEGGILLLQLRLRSAAGKTLGYRTERFRPGMESAEQSFRFRLPEKCASIDGSLRLCGVGSVEVSEPELRPAGPEPFRAEIVPASVREHGFLLPEGAPGVLRIAIHGDPDRAEKLLLTLRLPRGFKLIDSGWNSGFVGARPLPGGTSEYRIRPGTRAPRHTLDVSLLLDSEFPASGRSYPAFFRLDDGDRKGGEQPFILKVAPAPAGRKPKHFLAVYSPDLLFSGWNEATATRTRAFNAAGFNAFNGGGSGFDRELLPRDTVFLFRLRSIPPCRRKAGTPACEVLRSGRFFETLPEFLPSYLTRRPGRLEGATNASLGQTAAINCLCPRCRGEWRKFDPTLKAADLGKRSDAWLRRHYAVSLARFRAARQRRMLRRSAEIFRQTAEKRGSDLVFRPMFSTPAQAAEAGRALERISVRMFGIYRSRLNKLGDFHALGLANFLEAEQLRRKLGGTNAVNLLALPHFQHDRRAPTAGESAFEYLGYFVAGWEGAEPALAAGADCAYYARIAAANALIAANEKLRKKGRAADSRCRLEIIAAPPPPRFPAFADGSGIPLRRRSELERESPIQLRSRELGGTLLAMIGNFSESSAAKVKLRIDGMRGGRKRIEINGENHGSITPAEAKRGIPLTLPPQSWLFVRIFK